MRRKRKRLLASKKKVDPEKEKIKFIDAIEKGYYGIAVQAVQVLKRFPHINTLLKDTYPMLQAVDQMNLKMVRLLIDSGFDLNRTNKKGESCFHILTKHPEAIAVKWTIIFHTLLKQGANRWIRDQQGNLAMDLCKMTYQRDCFEKVPKTVFESVYTLDSKSLILHFENGSTANQKDNQGIPLIYLLENMFTVHGKERTDTTPIQTILYANGAF